MRLSQKGRSVGRSRNRCGVRSVDISEDLEETEPHFGKSTTIACTCGSRAMLNLGDIANRIYLAEEHDFKCRDMDM